MASSNILTVFIRSVADLAVMRSLPHMTVVAPADGTELRLDSGRPAPRV